MLIYNDTELLSLVLSHTRKRPPNNYSEYFMYKQEEYIYMSSVDPHTHRKEFPEFDKMWTVIYKCVDEDFRFVYYDSDDKLIVQEVELDVPYTFNSHRRHAVIHKELVSKWDNKYYWKNVWEPENELRCIFKIVDY